MRKFGVGAVGVGAVGVTAAEVTVRPARADDVEVVLALWQAAGSAPTVTDDADGVAALLAHDPGALLVAVDDGRVVGSLMAAWDGWRGHLYRMAVHPDVRRRGIARALVDAGEERLAALGCRRIDAIVLTDEVDARSLWAAAGYHEQLDVTRWVKSAGLA